MQGIKTFLTQLPLTAPLIKALQMIACVYETDTRATTFYITYMYGSA